jgi:hypothetical protein
MQKIEKSGGRKYAVIPEEIYEALKNQHKTQEQTESPEFAKAKELDNEIDNVLAAKSIPQDQRVNLYSNLASQFMDARERAAEIKSAEPFVSIATPSPTYMEAQKQPAELNLFDNISNARRRQEAEAIVEEIEGHPNVIDWDNTTQELIVHGVRQRGTNLGDILNHITKPNPSKNEELKPRGLYNFLEAYGEMGGNPDLVANNQLKNVVRGGALEDREGRGMNNVIQWETL